MRSSWYAMASGEPVGSVLVGARPHLGVATGCSTISKASSNPSSGFRDLKSSPAAPRRRVAHPPTTEPWWGYDHRKRRCPGRRPNRSLSRSNHSSRGPCGSPVGDRQVLRRHAVRSSATGDRGSCRRRHPTTSQRGSQAAVPRNHPRRWFAPRSHSGHPPASSTEA